VGAPIDAATSPSQILVLDYRGLITAAQIIETPPVHFSAFSGKMIALGIGRRWCPWILSANSCDRVERNDGTAQVFLGNGAGTGKIYELADSYLSDDGAAIDSYYQTYFMPSHVEEQTYQLGSRRKLFAWLSEYVEGSGSLAQTAYVDNAANADNLAAVTLASPATLDAQQLINVLGERVSFRFGTNAAGSWFKMQRFIPAAKPDPWSPVR
jgi:hypothetical protein